MFEALNHFPRETILESFSRAFYVTLSTSCGANAPLPRTRCRVCSTQVLHLHTHPPRISRLAPCLGNPMGHVRVEARRMKPPALAACRACATDQGTALHVAAFLQTNFDPSCTALARRVACIRLNSSADLLGAGSQKGRIALVGRGFRNPLAAERLPPCSSLVHPGRLVTCKVTQTDRSYSEPHQYLVCCCSRGIHFLTAALSGTEHDHASTELKAVYK